MTSFRCSGCLKNKRIPTSAYDDAPTVMGYCDFNSKGMNPTPDGCLYPKYLSAEKRENRVKWVRV